MLLTKPYKCFFVRRLCVFIFFIFIAMAPKGMALDAVTTEAQFLASLTNPTVTQIEITSSFSCDTNTILIPSGVTVTIPSGSQLTIATGSTLEVDGGGTLSISTGGTLAISGNTAKLTIDSASTFGNDPGSSIIIGTGAELDNASGSVWGIDSGVTLLNYGTMKNFGTMNIDTSSFTTYGFFYNWETITINGVLDNMADFFNENTGTIMINSGGELHNQEWVQSRGTIQVLSGGSIVNEALTTFENMLGTGILTNAGTITTYGPFNNMYRMSNSGTILNYGSMGNTFGGTWTNTGQFTTFPNATFGSDPGATLDNQGTYINQGNYNNYGIILNSGNFASSATATIFNDTTGTLTNNGQFNYNCVLQNYGIINGTKPYQVVFNASGGLIPSGAYYGSLLASGLVVQPANPTKKGFSFSGWYKEASLSNLWNFTTDTVSTDAILHAKWTPDPIAPIPSPKPTDPLKPSHNSVTPEAAPISQSIVYRVDGNGQIYAGQSKGLRFIIHADYFKFRNVEGLEQGKDYIVSSGSTILHLKSSYLDTLSDGEYSLVSSFSDGIAAISFRVARRVLPVAFVVPFQPESREQPAAFIKNELVAESSHEFEIID